MSFVLLSLNRTPGLAIRAPICGACLISLLTHHDDGTASAALLPLASVDPQPVAHVHGVSCSAVASVGDDRIARAIEYIRLHKFAPGFDNREHLALRDAAHRTEGVYAGGKCDLAFVDVAKAGEYTLVEQHDGDLFGGVGSSALAQSFNTSLDGEFISENKRAELRDLRVAR